MTNKLFSMMVLLVIAAPDSDTAESDINLILQRDVSNGALKDWAWLRNASGSIPDASELPMSEEEYKKGDAFKLATMPPGGDWLDFCARFLGGDYDTRFANYLQLLRIRDGNYSDAVDRDGDGIVIRYHDEDYRMWVVEFEEDIVAVDYQITITEHHLMRDAIKAFVNQTRS